ncbi:hypothetical protein OESDEN_08460 [Oesophagostomum dentatum]|uniref:Uncharacterized protein n=1 Tax=Oesophagostomum dentatum TaxID=61180 RepID=A0A0B1T7C4_OESDE|nr:hypothetical protein OESDEN_08460 [Oesophagostomum dentatum]
MQAGREKPKLVLDSSRALPCCQDESGGAVCRTSRANNPSEFLRKCNTEPDFSLVVCCKSCNDATINYKERGALFFNTQNNTSLCFDRMSLGYCSRFLSSSDTWSGKRYPLAFSTWIPRLSAKLRLLLNGLEEFTRSN